MQPPPTSANIFHDRTGEDIAGFLPQRIFGFFNDDDDIAPREAATVSRDFQRMFGAQVFSLSVSGVRIRHRGLGGLLPILRNDFSVYPNLRQLGFVNLFLPRIPGTFDDDREVTETEVAAISQALNERRAIESIFFSGTHGPYVVSILSSMPLDDLQYVEIFGLYQGVRQSGENDFIPRICSILQASSKLRTLKLSNLHMNDTAIAPALTQLLQAVPVSSLSLDFRRNPLEPPTTGAWTTWLTFFKDLGRVSELTVGGISMNKLVLNPRDPPVEDDLTYAVPEALVFGPDDSIMVALARNILLRSLTIVSVFNPDTERHASKYIATHFVKNVGNLHVQTLDLRSTPFFYHLHDEQITGAHVAQIKDLQTILFDALMENTHVQNVSFEAIADVDKFIEYIAKPHVKRVQCVLADGDRARIPEIRAAWGTRAHSNFKIGYY